MRTTDGSATREPQWVRAVHGLSGVMAVVAGLCLVLLAIHVIANVTSRFLFNDPVDGTLEITAAIWMPLTIALGFALTEHKQEHIQVNQFVAAASPALRRRVQRTTAFLVVLVLAALTYFTALDALHALEIRQTTTGPVPAPVWASKLAVAAAMLAFLAEAIVTATRPTRAAELDEAETAEEGQL